MGFDSHPSYRIELECLPGGKGEEAEIEFLAHVLNTGPVVGKDISVVLFAPDDLLDFPKEANRLEKLGTFYSEQLCWECNGAAYSAVHGSCKRQLYPLESDVVVFEKVVSLSKTPVLAQHFRVVVKVFDSEGIALTAVFQVRVADGETTLEKQIRPDDRGDDLLGAGELI